MNELLANPAVQTALVLVIVTALNAFVAWLKQKFPTQVASVEANWCYLQPVVDLAMAKVEGSIANPSFKSSALSSIVAQALVDFGDTYRKFEGKDPTAAEIKAARAEIVSAVERVTGG